jgi:hypothetical protein
MISRRIPGAVGGRPARTFVAASTQYLEATTGFGLGANDPFFFVLLANRGATTTSMVMASLGLSGTAADGRRILTSSTDAIQAQSVNAASSVGTASSAAAAFTVGAWVPIIAEFSAVNARRIITAGVAVTNTTSRTLTGAPTTLRVGTSLSGTNAYTGNMWR